MILSALFLLPVLAAALPNVLAPQNASPLGLPIELAKRDECFHVPIDPHPPVNECVQGAWYCSGHDALLCMIGGYYTAGNYCPSNYSCRMVDGYPNCLPCSTL